MKFEELYNRKLDEIGASGSAVNQSFYGVPVAVAMDGTPQDYAVEIEEGVFDKDLEWSHFKGPEAERKFPEYVEKHLTSEALKTAREGAGLGSGMYNDLDIIRAVDGKKERHNFLDLDPNDPLVYDVIKEFYPWSFKPERHKKWAITFTLIDDTLVGLYVRNMESSGSGGKIFLPPKWKSQIEKHERDVRSKSYSSTAKEINKWRYD